MLLAFTLSLFICLTNYVGFLVENHYKLAISLIKVPTKLNIHIARNACTDIIWQPNTEIDGVERNVKLALLLINFVFRTCVNIDKKRHYKVCEVQSESYEIGHKYNIHKPIVGLVFALRIYLYDKAFDFH